MLDGCARKQMTSLAGHILSDMESSGIAPSSHTRGTQMFFSAKDGRRMFVISGSKESQDTYLSMLQEVDGR